MTDTVKFDPGIGEMAVDFNNYVNISPQNKFHYFKSKPDYM